jgi:stage III sporulation protein AB
MIKFLLGIAVVLFCVGCGRLFLKKYRIRRGFFTQLQEFNQRFLTEVSYYRRPLQEFYAQFTYEGEFQELLENFFHLQEKGEVIKHASFLDLSAYSFLTEEERTFVGDYFLTLGRGDCASQKAYFSAADAVLKGYRLTSEEECKKHTDLYTKLGFLCGLAILIIIV